MYIFSEFYFIFMYVIKGLCLATVPLNPNIWRTQVIVFIGSTQPVLPRYSCPSRYFLYVIFKAMDIFHSKQWDDSDASLQTIALINSWSLIDELIVINWSHQEGLWICMNMTGY